MFKTQQFAINNPMSLYIPHVFPNFDQEYIAGVFEGLDYGSVERVDLVSKMDKNGNNYNAAYIHFSKWEDNVMVENFQARITDPEREARIVHDDPWFWIVLENKAKKHIPGERKLRINILGDPIDDFEQEKEENIDSDDISLSTLIDEWSNPNTDYYNNLEYIENYVRDRNSQLLEENERLKNSIMMLLEENEQIRLKLQNECFQSSTLAQTLDERDEEIRSLYNKLAQEYRMKGLMKEYKMVDLIR